MQNFARDLISLGGQIRYINKSLNKFNFYIETYGKTSESELVKLNPCKKSCYLKLAKLSPR